MTPTGHLKLILATVLPVRRPGPAGRFPSTTRRGLFLVAVGACSGVYGRWSRVRHRHPGDSGVRPGAPRVKKQPAAFPCRRR